MSEIKIYTVVSDDSGLKVVEAEAKETTQFYKIVGWPKGWSAFSFRTNLPKHTVSLTPQDALERFIELQTGLITRLTQELDEAKTALNRAGLELHNLKQGEAGR